MSALSVSRYTAVKARLYIYPLIENKLFSVIESENSSIAKTKIIFL